MRLVSKGELKSIQKDTEMMARTLANHVKAIDNLAVIPPGTEDSFALLQALQTNIGDELKKIASTVGLIVSWYDPL